jgi:hypothetical protein
MRIRALSVFEGVVYHCWAIDTDQPCRPTLEVEAVLRPGDADADAGPLLLSVAEYIVMAGGLDVARPCLRDMATAGRIVEHLGVEHIAFPTWTPVSADAAPDDDNAPDAGQPDAGHLDTGHPNAGPRPSLRVVQPPAEDTTG